MTQDPKAPATHDLKCWPQFFQEVKAGRKPFEKRKADRPYKLGDFLHLREWDPATEGYTGDSVKVGPITYILEQDGAFGEEGWVTMGFPLSPPPVGVGEREALRECLAELCHAQWSGWMEYLFSKCVDGEEFGLAKGQKVIPAWAVARWSRQINATYADLPEDEKESDRKEADRILDLLPQTAPAPLPLANLRDDAASLGNLIDFLSHKKGEIDDLCVNPGRLWQTVEAAARIVIALGAGAGEEDKGPSAPFLDVSDLGNSREDRLTAALRYARRFLKPEDHDTEYVDAILKEARGEDGDPSAPKTGLGEAKTPQGDSAAVSVLISNLARIQGLAKGAADAIQICKAGTNWEGVTRTLLEIERLAGDLLPASPRAPEGLPKGSNPSPISPELRGVQGAGEAGV